MTTNVEPIKITGLERDPLRGRATRLMTEALAKLTVGPVKGQAAFFDDNGPKGGRAMRCALTVRLPFRPSIRVERSAVTPRLAFDAAFAVLERDALLEPRGDLALVHPEHCATNGKGLAPLEAEDALQLEAGFRGLRAPQPEPDPPLRDVDHVKGDAMHQKLRAERRGIGDSILLAIMCPRHQRPPTRAAPCDEGSPARRASAQAPATPGRASGARRLRRR